MAAAVAPAMVEEALVGGQITAVAMGKPAAEYDATVGKYDMGLGLELEDVATNALLPAPILSPTPIKVGEIAVGIAFRPPAAFANLYLFLLLMTVSCSKSAAAIWCGCGIIIAKGTL